MKNQILAAAFTALAVAIATAVALTLIVPEKKIEQRDFPLVLLAGTP